MADHPAVFHKFYTILVWCFLDIVVGSIRKKDSQLSYFVISLFMPGFAIQCIVFSFSDASEGVVMYDDIPHEIVSVALVQPKPSVFTDNVPYLLAVATPVEVLLLAIVFRPEDMPMMMMMMTNNGVDVAQQQQQQPDELSVILNAPFDLVACKQASVSTLFSNLQL